MRAARIVSWMLIFIAVGAAATSWLTPRPEISAADAADVAIGALDAADVDASLAKPVVPSGFIPAGSDPIDVWVVFATVGDDTIELRVDQASGQLVWVNDNVGPNGSQRLLDDDQFAVVADYRSSELPDWIRGNVAGSFAAAAIALVGFVLSKRSDGLWTRPTPAPELAAG